MNRSKGLRDKVLKITGRFSWVVNGDELCMLAKCVNTNADVLKELIKKVEKLEAQGKETQK